MIPHTIRSSPRRGVTGGAGEYRVGGLRNLLLLAFSLTMSTGPTAGAQLQDAPEAKRPATLTVEDLRATVGAMHARIDNLSVAYSFNAEKSFAGDLGYVSHHKTTIKGGKTLDEHTYGSAPGADQRLFTRVIAYNGNRSTLYAPDQRAAAVNSKPPQENTRGTGFFDTMLLNPPGKPPDGTDGSLVSLVNSPHATLRPDQELVAGRWCHVLDVTPPRARNHVMTVWLDADRGGLPVRQVHYAPPDRDLILQEYTIEESVEVEPGVWLATKGRARQFPVLKNVPELTVLQEYVLRVDVDANGRPQVAVNTDIDDKVFDLTTSPRLPR